MRSYLLCLIVALVGSAFPAPASAEDATTNKLVGTWKLVSAKYGGVTSSLPKTSTTVKHFTPTHFMWATYGETGKVTRTAGGPYTFDGKMLEETAAYGMGPDLSATYAKRLTFSARWKGTGTIRAVIFLA